MSRNFQTTLREYLRRVTITAPPIAHILGDDWEAELPAASALMQWQHLGPGEVLVQQGDPADDLFLLVVGQADATQRLTDEDGESGEELVNRLVSPDLIGELAMALGTPRTATVTTTTECVVLRLPAQSLALLHERAPRIQLALQHWQVQDMAAKLVRTETRAKPVEGDIHNTASEHPDVRWNAISGRLDRDEGGSSGKGARFAFPSSSSEQESPVQGPAYQITESARHTVQTTERERRRHLAGVPLALGTLLLLHGELVTVRSGDALIADGEQGGSLWLLVSGEAAVAGDLSITRSFSAAAFRLEDRLVGELSFLRSTRRMTLEASAKKWVRDSQSTFAASTRRMNASVTSTVACSVWAFCSRRISASARPLSSS